MQKVKKWKWWVSYCLQDLSDACWIVWKSCQDAKTLRYKKTHMIFSILWYFTIYGQLSLQSTNQHDIIDVVEEKWRSGDRRYFFSGSMRKQIHMNENVHAQMPESNVDYLLVKDKWRRWRRKRWINLHEVRTRRWKKQGQKYHDVVIIEYRNNDKRTLRVGQDIDWKSRNDSWLGIRSPRRWRQSNLIEPNYWHDNHQWQCQLESAWQWTLSYHHVNQLRRRIANTYNLHLLA